MSKQMKEMIIGFVIITTIFVVGVTSHLFLFEEIGKVILASLICASAFGGLTHHTLNHIEDRSNEIKFSK